MMVLNNIAVKAEAYGVYNVQSKVRGMLYCYADGEYALVRPNGLVRIRASELDTVIAELTGIRDDVKDLLRIGIER